MALLCGPGADKAAAALWLSAYLGISMAQVIAFGDDGNDATMLKAVGWGVAMENGIEEVKKTADAVAISASKHQNVTRGSGSCAC